MIIDHHGKTTSYETHQLYENKCDKTVFFAKTTIIDQTNASE